MTAIAFKYTTTHKYNVKCVRKVPKRLNIVFVIVGNILITNNNVPGIFEPAFRIVQDLNEYFTI